jgi:hypothetical protein
MAKDEYFELVVRTSSGSIDTRLLIPIDSTPQQRDAFVRLWLDAIHTAVHYIPQETPCTTPS